jgi:hypothetical protein
MVQGVIHSTVSVRSLELANFTNCFIDVTFEDVSGKPWKISTSLSNGSTAKDFVAFETIIIGSAASGSKSEAH